MALKKKSVKAVGKKEAEPKAGAEAKPQVEPEKKEPEKKEEGKVVAAVAAPAGGVTGKQLRRMANRKKQREMAQKEKDTKPAVTDEMKVEATKRAIEVIKKGLTEDPACQKKGFPFLPTQWVTEFKDILGPYMKFVERCRDFVVVHGDRPGRYTVHLQGDDLDLPDMPEAERLKPKKDWELKLRNSWQVYLQSTPKAERKPEEFVEMARKLSDVVNLGKDAVPGAQAQAKGAKDAAKADAEDKPAPKRKSVSADAAPKKKAKKA